jgi:Cu/Ag efflux pump CusA
MRTALLVMVNVPLALIGSAIGASRPGRADRASLVGFITLFGIATRNGILLISDYEQLQDVDWTPFDEALERGSLVPSPPILMTALSAGPALIPLVLDGDQPGNEIEAPMGVVILGGLLSSKALNMLVVPALYTRVGRRRTLAISRASLS